MKNLTPKAAKVELKKRGHSYRSAARELGVSYQFMSDVCNGNSTSRPLLEKIFQLSIRKPQTGGAK